MSASYLTKMIVAFRSGDRCAFPGCNRTLTVDGKSSDTAIIGEAAHISGEKPGSARYDKLMAQSQRNHHDNLIYLCRDHHAQIDKQHSDYSVDVLHQMKADHERKVREAMSETIVEVGFQELMDVTDWISTIDSEVGDQNFSLISPEDKLVKNELGTGSRNVITMGLSVANNVKKFIETSTQINPEFPERLKSGFLREYYRLKCAGYAGDELFDLMCSFAQRGFTQPVKQNAGIAVLVYLFETCEVFEK